MTIEFTPWPEPMARRYRDLGYWEDKPLSDVLRVSCVKRPSATAIICAHRYFSYTDIDRLSNNLAQSLLARGLKPYDTALVQLPNIAEFYIVFFALIKIGVVPVNALYSHQRLELTAYAQQLHPTLIVASASHPLFSEGSFLEDLKREIPSLQQALIYGENHYADLLEDGLNFPEQIAQLEPTPAGEVAFFQLSGGSTGTPKLIPRTHNDYLYSVRRSAELCGLGPQTRFLCALPAGHNFTLSSPGALGVFDNGGTVITAPDPEPFNCFSLISQHQINMVALVPPAVALWLKAAEAHRDKLATLSLMQVGGANFAESIARRVPEELGCQLQQVFGMAEGLVNYTRLDDDDPLIFCTQGCPMCPDDEVLVVDENCQPVPPGETGMLITRGPYTIRGYYKSGEHNQAAFDAGGFYRTGDLVQRDGNGYLRVVGRQKDQINRGGEKIAAEEVENLLLRHKSISQAALVAMPDDLLGEKSCAFLVSSDPDLRPLVLRKYLRDLGVAQFKLPDKFKFVRSLPLTPIGKTDKKKLRKVLREKAVTSKV
ncbi:(2,3-dihydroxybenzoyl)adenylate synthase [Microbulbifer sp. OS29]|uniref:(2,3-dihydroxybenzoyl)adenylate synthase n=1 Tax=Microbulbifer okhotskensis TaxID=2926617 RepID=A0A9X2ELP5_9GAMM|nr:(2,3-dihydroxybenzoyl)adenylate synthase [Microbulbifer okhotskensis]MCO1334532.1 (2,3-dihydroxybenzoyl)adenylate synthase [Microbulbifer okhotskensis]